MNKYCLFYLMFLLLVVFILETVLMVPNSLNGVLILQVLPLPTRFNRLINIIRSFLYFRFNGYLKTKKRLNIYIGTVINYKNN